MTDTRYIVLLHSQGKEEPFVFRDLSSQESTEILIDYATPDVDLDSVSSRLYFETKDIPQDADFGSNLYEQYRRDIFDHLEANADYGVFYKISEKGNWFLDDVGLLSDAHHLISQYKSGHGRHNKYFDVRLSYRIKPEWKTVT